MLCRVRINALGTRRKDIDDDHTTPAPEDPGSGISHSGAFGLCHSHERQPDGALGSAAFRVLWRCPEPLSTLLPPQTLAWIPTLVF